MTEHANLPWFSGYRDGQAEAADEIIEAFRHVDLVLLNAPTGTGKTLIAETVRQRMEKKGLYLCTSLTLQDQYEATFPYAKILRGRSNYTPLAPFADRWGEMPTCADCDYRRDDGCSYCPDRAQCPYVRAKVDLLQHGGNSNTKYFLTEANGKYGELGGNFDFTVIDEAHLLEKDLLSYVSVSISPRMADELGIYPPKYKTKPDAWLDWLKKHLPVVNNYVAGMREPTTIKERRKVESIKRLQEKMQMMARAPEKWVYTGYDQGKIEFKPVMVDEFGLDLIWRHGGKWLAMSATFASDEEWTYKMGWPGDWRFIEMDSPFPVENRLVHYCPIANVVNRDKEQAWANLEAALDWICKEHPDERILVHTHSYALANYLRGGLAERGHERRLHCYLDASDRASAVEAYEGDPRGVLLASSLSHGYDGKDELVGVIVICKVPYPYLGDKQVSTRMRMGRDGAVWYASQTAEELMQMTGRGVRHKQDRCTIYLLDEQFGRFWREWKYPDDPKKHKLLRKWWTDALVWGGDKRKRIEAYVKRKAHIYG